MKRTLKRQYGKRLRSEQAPEPPRKLAKAEDQNKPARLNFPSPIRKTAPPSGALRVKPLNAERQARASSGKSLASMHVTKDTKSNIRSAQPPASIGLQAHPQQQQQQQQQLFLNFSDAASASTVHCKACGMSYARGAQPDMALHEQHHRKVTAGVQYKLGSCGQERVLQSYVSKGKGKARVEGSILVLPPHVKKAQEVIQVMNTELSASDLDDTFLVGSKLYLFVADNPSTRPSTKQQSGHAQCCIAAAALVGSIKTAFHVLPSQTTTTSSSSSSHGAIFASSQPTSALVGVHRMWCSTSFRRRGLVSTLLDAAARDFIYGRPLTTVEERRAVVAFSQPTESGGHLARAWLQIDGESEVKKDGSEAEEATSASWKVFDS